MKDQSFTPIVMIGALSVVFACVSALPAFAQGAVPVTVRQAGRGRCARRRRLTLATLRRMGGACYAGGACAGDC